MTNYVELIAEAEKRADQLEKYACMAKRDVDQEEMREDAKQLRGLVAAVRELAPPEGWRMTEYTREDGMCAWQARHPGAWWWLCQRSEDRRDYVMSTPFPTASAALAALDGEQKP